MSVEHDALKYLESALHPKVLAALENEYGSLENALAHFEKRFGEFAPGIMAETHPEFLDPIILRTPDGRGFNFWREHARRPWSLSEPRPGSMTELMVRYGLLVADEKGRRRLVLSGEAAEVRAEDLVEDPAEDLAENLTEDLLMKVLVGGAEKPERRRAGRRNGVGRARRVG